MEDDAQGERPAAAAPVSPASTSVEGLACSPGADDHDPPVDPRCGDSSLRRPDTLTVCQGAIFMAPFQCVAHKFNTHSQVVFIDN
jgi:hypothetical protein